MYERSRERVYHIQIDDLKGVNKQKRRRIFIVRIYNQQMGRKKSETTKKKQISDLELRRSGRIRRSERREERSNIVERARHIRFAVQTTQREEKETRENDDLRLLLSIIFSFIS